MAASTPSTLRLRPLDAALLEFYAKIYSIRTTQVLRSMLRRCALLDPELDETALAEHISQVPELQADSDRQWHCRKDWQIFCDMRAHRPTHKRLSTTESKRELTSLWALAQCTVSLTDFELTLVDHYARHVGRSRATVMRHLVRAYVGADRHFDPRLFNSFVTEAAQKVPQQVGAVLRKEVDEFLARL